MTTTPKAKKFRIRRSTSLTGDMRRVATGAPAPSPAPTAQTQQQRPPQRAPHAQQAKRPVEQLFDNDGEDGFGDQAFPTAQNANISEPAEVRTENDIAEIRKEGLTGRQLRMARRTKTWPGRNIGF